MDEILGLIDEGVLDAVALPFDPFDPFDHKAQQGFQNLSKSQKGGRPFLISYSTFNPSWIENLVSNVGSNLHIRGNPRIVEVIKGLESHFQKVVSLQ